MADKKKTKKQISVLDNNITVDVSDIDDTLTDRAKRFIFWFTYPGTDCFQNKARSAIRAGYAKKNAVSTGYKLCKNPTITKEIERLSGEFVIVGFLHSL